MSENTDKDGKQNEEEFFFYLETKVTAPKLVMTGAEIKQAIRAMVPTFDVTHNLVLEGHGNAPDDLIGDEQSVNLDHRHGGHKHFFSKPPTNFG